MNRSTTDKLQRFRIADIESRDCAAPTKQPRDDAEREKAHAGATRLAGKAKPQVSASQAKSKLLVILVESAANFRTR